MSMHRGHVRTRVRGTLTDASLHLTRGRTKVSLWKNSSGRSQLSLSLGMMGMNLLRENSGVVQW